MPDLNFTLHEKQKEIYLDSSRFKVCAAGRRGGKTHLACVVAGTEVLKDKNSYGMPLTVENEVWYICPIFEQGKKVMWAKLKDMWSDVIKKTWENTGTAEFVNGRVFRIMGADRPDNLRGSGLSYVILDEYAFMRPEVWDIIIRPMLMTTKGGALFIGTPEGKNHFYDLWLSAQEKDNWSSFHFTSRDNPLIDQEEIEGLAGENMSKAAIRQEIEASFEAAGGGHFSESEIKYAQQSSEPGTIYMAVDPAGFGTSGDLIESELKRRDETAIAIVEVSGKGWFIHDIVAGRWGIRETALRILREAQNYQPACVGIEKGALFNAIFPYLQDEMRRLGVYPVIEGVTHGGKKKTDRIMWALKGRFEKGRITFKEDPAWNQKFINQMLDFPNPMAHDDMLDALAYIDQVATTNYNIDTDQDSFVPLDAVIGI